MRQGKPTGSISVGMKILELIASGQASHRHHLVKQLGFTKSIVSAYVQKMLDASLLNSIDGDISTTASPRGRLSLSSGYFLGLILESATVQLAAYDIALNPILSAELTVDSGPDLRSILTTLPHQLQTGRHSSDLTGRKLLGVGVGLAEPAELLDDAVPTRPGGDTVEWLTVPTVINGEPYMVALGERCLGGEEPGNLLVVGAGAELTSVLLIAESQQHGIQSLAGDISHVTVPAASDQLCGCGNTGCLGTVASGAAIADRLREKGIFVQHTADIAQLADNGDPTVISEMRAAGGHLGTVLSTLVNFLHPRAVLLTGPLAASLTYLTGVRAVIYTRCLPVATRDLVVATANPAAGTLGAAMLARQTIVGNIQ